MRKKVKVTLLILTICFISLITIKNMSQSLYSDVVPNKIGIIDGPISQELNIPSTLQITEKTFSHDIREIDKEHGTSVFGIVLLEYKKNKIDEELLVFNAIVLSNGISKQAHIVDAINWCVEQNVNLINISIDIANISKDLEHAIKQAEKKNIPIFFANGNGNYSDSDSHISSQKNVFYVGSLTSDGQKSPREIRKANIYFSGEDINSFNHYGEKKLYSGSSYAAAVASSKVIFHLNNSSNYSNNRIIKNIEKEERQK